MMEFVEEMVKRTGGWYDPYHDRPTDESVTDCFAAMLVDLWDKLDRIENKLGTKPAKPEWEG